MVYSILNSQLKDIDQSMWTKKGKAQKLISVLKKTFVSLNLVSLYLIILILIFFKYLSNDLTHTFLLDNISAPQKSTEKKKEESKIKRNTAYFCIKHRPQLENNPSL
jgi:hypothetical protein